MANSVTNIAIIEMYKAQNNISSPLHTYTKWQALGYQVKKGEKSIHRITIWKHVKRKKKVETDEESAEIISGKCIMKTACFFTLEQVERIEKKA